VDELDAPHFGQATLMGADAVLSNFAPHARQNFAVDVFFCLHFQQSTSAVFRLDFVSFIFCLVLRRRAMKMLRRTAVAIIKTIAVIFSASGKYDAAAAFH
jgi:hypothetical protein